MKNYILILSLSVLIILGISVKIYVKAVGTLQQQEKNAVLQAKKKVKLSEVDDFHIFNGNETVKVIEGKNKQGEKIIVWIPGKSENILVKKAKEGLSKEQAVQKLLQEKKPKKIISVRLGMEKNIPLWEIYYRSNNNLINYYYIDFETGDWLKKIENI